MEQEVIKKGFFRRIWYSITKIEKYPNMSAEGTKKAFSYLTGLILIFSIIFSISLMFKIQNLDDILMQSEIEEEQRQIILEYINNTDKLPLYAGFFIISFMSSYTIFFIATIFFVIVLSAFGYLTAIILKIKMKYVAIFNMAIYSITLSAILELIYTITNLYTEFESPYFSLAYIAISCVYLISAIFIIKSEFIKKKEELNKIEEVQKEIKEERKEE